MVEDGSSGIEQSESLRKPQEADLGKPLPQETKIEPAKNRFVSKFGLLGQRRKSKEEVVGVIANQEYVSGEPLHLLNIKNLSQRLTAMPVEEKELVDILSKRKDLISNLAIDSTSNSFLTSLEVIRNFFRYYKERVYIDKIESNVKHLVNTRPKIRPNVHKFANFGVSFLDDSMQGIEARMDDTQSLEEETLLVEAVSELANFGKGEQITKSVDFLLKNFDSLLKICELEYDDDDVLDVPYPKSTETFSVLGTIFEKGNAEQLGKVMRRIGEYMHGESGEAKEVILDKIFIAINTRSITKQVIERILNDYGINSGKVAEDWKLDSNSSRLLKHLIAKNLARLSDMEAQIPGIGSHLYSEFGITDFARYPKEMLIAQYEDKDKKDDIPYGVLVYPKDESGGSFHYDPLVLQNLYIKLKGRSRIRIFETGDTQGLVHILNDSRKRWGKISFGIIGGHGTRETIRLGDSDKKRSILRKEEVERSGASAVKLAFVDNPSIILVSCSTGQLGGIGHELSKIGAKVIAPPTPTHPESIDPVFLEDGGVDFKVKFSGTQSNTYSLGEYKGNT